MNEALPSEQQEKSTQRGLPFDGVALVLQGGGALGAYQAGAFQAIQEAKIEVSWLCGTSIGAVNAALIVGNQPPKRVERLREFWEAITNPQISFPNIPWFPDLSSAENGARYWTNKISIFTTMMRGFRASFLHGPFHP